MIYLSVLFKMIFSAASLHFFLNTRGKQNQQPPSYLVSKLNNIKQKVLNGCLSTLSLLFLSLTLSMQLFQLRWCFAFERALPVKKAPAHESKCQGQRAFLELHQRWRALDSFWDMTQLFCCNPQAAWSGYSGFNWKNRTWERRSDKVKVKQKCCLWSLH